MLRMRMLLTQESHPLAHPLGDIYICTYTVCITIVSPSSLPSPGLGGEEKLSSMHPVYVYILCFPIYAMNQNKLGTMVLNRGDDPWSL
jgi:hypothetical protein